MDRDSAVEPATEIGGRRASGRISCHRA